MKHGCESEESGRQYQCKSCQERLLRKGQEKLNGESNSRAVLLFAVNNSGIVVGLILWAS